MGDKDIISKQAVKGIALDLATLLFKLDIDPDSLELLQTEHQRVEDRRADLVAQVRERGKTEPFILHIEIQNDNDSLMPLRMLRYYTDIQFSYPLERIQQYVIYIGKARLNMPNGIHKPNLEYHYQILDMHQIDCQSLLDQDTPDALLLAILCDFKDQPTQDVINYIIRRLRELLADDESQFRNYLQMLEILSENRNLQPHIEKAETMLTQVDVKKLPSYRLGKKQGVESGVEIGIEQGTETTRLEIACKLLAQCSDEFIVNNTGLSLQKVQALRLEQSLK